MSKQISDIRVVATSAIVSCFDIVLNNYTLYDNMILKDEIRYIKRISYKTSYINY